MTNISQFIYQLSQNKIFTATVQTIALFILFSAVQDSYHYVKRFYQIHKETGKEKLSIIIHFFYMCFFIFIIFLFILALQ